MRINIELPTEESVTKFCARANRFTQDIDVTYKHYVLNAKVVMGVQSIPRTEQLSVYVHDVSPGDSVVHEIIEAFKEFEKRTSA